MKRLLLVPSLCLAAWCAEPPRSGGQLQLALGGEPKTFDPFLASDEPSDTIRYLTQGVLIRMNRATQRLEPELALSWKAAEGGKAIVFQLRQGVAFSDGSPFTSADVCATFRRLMDPALDSPLADSFESAKGKVGCAANDAHGVTLRLPAPIAGFERLLDSVAIVPAKGGQAALGPFAVKEHRPGASITLARNPHYWKKDSRGVRLPYLDAIRFEIQRNRDFELLRFRNGEFHIVKGLDPELYERVKGEMPNATKDLGPSLDTEQIWFNQVPGAPLPAHKKAWFASREFRVAVSEAIRRDDMVRVVYQGYGIPSIGPVSPANQLWFNNALRNEPADPKRALARLERDGFRKQGAALRDRSGNAVEFSLITNSGNKVRERLCAMIQADLAVLGIKVNPVPLDFPSLIDRITRSFNYEASLLGMLNNDVDPNAQMNVWLSSGANHQWNPNQKSPATAWEAELDRLMVAQSTELNPAKRKAAFHRVQQVVLEQAPFIYLVNRNALVAVSPAVRNVQPAILQPQALWNAEWIYLAEAPKLAVK